MTTFDKISSKAVGGNPFPPQFLPSNALRRGRCGKLLIKLNFRRCDHLPHTGLNREVIYTSKSIVPSPLISTSMTRARSSSSVGFCPMLLITLSNSLVEIVPLPS